MSKINDGGPAFPGQFANQGMSLRHYFAAKAMEALLARADLSFVFKPGASPPTFNAWNDPRKCYSRVLAELSYKAADALLAASGRKGGAT